MHLRGSYSPIPLLWRLVTSLLMAGLLSACGSAPTATTTHPTLTITATLAPTHPRPSPTNTPTAASSATPSPTDTPQPQADPGDSVKLPVVLSPEQQPTTTWSNISDHQASVPILMYHHISADHPKNRYYVSPENFAAQMDALHQAGYTAITVRVLANAIRENGLLPDRPVVITFDDGDLDVYQNAFPIMRKYGFPGTFFVLSSWLKAKGFIHAEQLQEMSAAGWEVGSHSMTHANLTAEGVDFKMEVFQSRLDLEEALHVPVDTFAYPFSSSNEMIIKKTGQYGYNAAVCSGWNNQQRLGNILCLSRREVKWDTTLEKFLSFLQPP